MCFSVFQDNVYDNPHMILYYNIEMYLKLFEELSVDKISGQECLFQIQHLMLKRKGGSV